MFSLKPLVLYFLFAFGILSSLAIPRDAPRANADDDTLLDIIQALNTSLTGPLEQLGKLCKALSQVERAHCQWQDL